MLVKVQVTNRKGNFLQPSITNLRESGDSCDDTNHMIDMHPRGGIDAINYVIHLIAQDYVAIAPMRWPRAQLFYDVRPRWGLTRLSLTLVECPLLEQGRLPINELPMSPLAA